MRTEELLKSYIVDRYGTVKNFCKEVQIPASTISTVFKRGLENSGFNTVSKICFALNISLDNLAQGEIAPSRTTFYDAWEKSVVFKVHQLNGKGQAKLCTYLDDLLENPANKSGSQTTAG